MFKNISQQMIDRMKYLENIDEIDRKDGTTRMKRLRQIPPETGKFISILAANTPKGSIIEIGTSAGYSTMWLSLAAKEKNTKVITHELLEEKILLAKETFQKAQIENFVQLVEGDALKTLGTYSNTAFCFIDCEKEMYESCWDQISDNIVPGGLIVADNAINHYETIKPMVNKALADERFDSVIVPIGKGELVCRKI